MSDNPFDNIPPDDQDHLLWMLLEAHKPFPSRSISIGEIADEWVARHRKTLPREPRDIARSFNPVTASLGQAYRRPRGRVQ